MKTQYILFILLLSFNLVSAQDTTEVIKSESGVMVLPTSEDALPSVNTIEEAGTKEATLARISDIRTYLNMVRNVENIDLLFPKLNKEVKA